MTELRRFYEQWALWICLGLVGLVIGVHVYRFSRELDEIAAAFELEAGPQASLLYDRHGRLVFSFHDEERVNRRLSELSSSIEPAVLAAEDRHFRSHAGIDLKRMAGAAWSDVKARRLAQGASTITQQLVRLQALGRERTWSRKWREILLALRIERRFTKDQILETYLNRIYLGDGFFGMQAAARGYFDKDASALNDSEAALLAGIIRCPSSCSPRNKPEKARTRRNVVLRAMLRNGSLPASAVASAMAATPRIESNKHPKTFLPEHKEGNDVSGLYFIDAVRRQLIAHFGEGAVLRGGLRVYTTLDVGLQQAAEDAISARLIELKTPTKPARGSSPNANPVEANPVEGSLVAIDPRSGEVLALVGGRDFHASPYNRAVQARRQPGSAFKPILFAAALEQGHAPSEILDQLDTPIGGVDGDWLPDGEHEANAYTLRQALIVSSNRAAARLLQMVGLSSAQYYARRLGIDSTLPSVPSLALGTAEVSLIELTSVYGVFANEGVLVPPTLIKRVQDAAGDPLWQPPRTATQALRPNTAFLMSTMLADAMNHGTGAGARAQGFKLPAGGKTGTTDSYADAWFIGYTPSLVAGVWFGRDQPEPIGQRGFAATVAVPAWTRFMKHATANAKPEWFPVPADLEKVTICLTSGLVATPACRLATASGGGGVITDYFQKGMAPKEPCGIHILNQAFPGSVEPANGPLLVSGAVEPPDGPLHLPGGVEPPDGPLNMPGPAERPDAPLLGPIRPEVKP